MCAFSAVIDNVARPWQPLVPTFDNVSRGEFEMFRRKFEVEIRALRELLPHVQKYDEATGQPDCESDEKLALLRMIAEKLGVDVKGIA